MERPTSYLEINLNRVKHNYNTYKAITNKQVFAVVKANAYGLGMVELAKYFDSLNSVYLCVSSLEEALILREHGIKSSILILGYVKSDQLELCLKHNLTVTVVSLEYAYEIKESQITSLKLHLKYNTSMNRLGLDNQDEVNKAYELLSSENTIEGIFTHYANNDLSLLEKDFLNFKNIVKSINHKFTYIHASSSNSSLILKEDFTNAVRIGIGLYGGILSDGLLNVVSLYTEVISIKELSENKTVGYDGVYKTEENDIIASIKLGYGDGIIRADKGAKVMINNKEYPIVANVCMDQSLILVDKDVNLYDTVEVFGNNYSIKHLAKHRNTIVYEVLTLISNRVKRIYINK